MTADHINRAADEISGIQVGTGYESVTIGITAALEAARALDAAGLLVSPECDAAVAAKAWDEGFASGFYTGTSPRWGEGSDASEPDVTNPYEREAGESDADA